MGDAANWLSSKTVASCCGTGVIAPFLAYGAGGYYFFKHCNKEQFSQSGTVWLIALYISRSLSRDLCGLLVLSASMFYTTELCVDDFYYML